MAISNNSTGLRTGVCTSTTRPTAPYEGQHIYETDTDLSFFWNGTAWAATYAGSGFRNILINGGFDIWQRGSAQTTLPAALATAFLADRWSGHRAVAGCTQTRIASELNGFQYAIRLQRTSGNTTVNPMYLEQSFETSTISKVAGLPVVVSFYARAGSNFTGSTILARLGVGTGTERNVIWSSGWTSYIEPLTQQVTPTTNWQRFVLYVTVPAGTTQAGFYFTVSPTGTASTNDYVDITGVQIEAGSQVTPFEQRPVATELVLCQRYYENSGYPNYTVPTSVTGQGAWIPAASAYTLCSEPQFKTTKKSTPTITIYNTNTLASGSITEYIAGGAFVTNRTSAVSYVSTTKFMVNSAAQYATGRDYNFSWEAYAELA